MNPETLNALCGSAHGVFIEAGSLDAISADHVCANCYALRLAGQQAVPTKPPQEQEAD